MELLTQPTKKRAVASLNSDSDKIFASPTFGEVLPLSVAMVNALTIPIGQRIFDPQVWTSWTALTAIVGNPSGTITITTSGLLVVGKTYQIILFVAGDNFTNVGAGSNASGVTFVATGTTPTTWTHLSQLRLVPDASASVLLTTASSAADVTLTQLTVGGAGANAKWRAAITQTPYLGSFTMTIRGCETSLIQWNASDSDVKTALEALSQTSGTLVSGAKYKIVTFVAGDDFTNIGGTNVTGNVFTASGTTPTTWTNKSILTPTGSGNVNVVQEATSQWVFSLVGDMANTAIGTVTRDASALSAIPYLSGNLALYTQGLATLLNGATSVATNLVIAAIPPGLTYYQELARIPITLNASIP